MPELQTPQTAGKTIWIIVAAVIGVAVIAALIWWQFAQAPAPEALVPPAAAPEVEAPAPPPAPPAVAPEEDTTTSIQQDLETVDLGDLEQEFKQIDADAGEL
ncbi:MAG: hypothetical protein UX53_C0004G0029 [Candidatus Azambacteria bacterium GW2011_GWB2_46_37]|uniref:Uncharacterized protein n=3 Tax=Candidatus Azamiibacteriota TaxID=1752741 RepID=A0A0G1SLH2_9BACT|nr:MAG: hypothetical protein UX51_C0047G0004 [Candidatus Azambacteria bacterium GW2011_GWF2_46_32]KKU39528.1 MAG: hypothetical protein UX53_C0004G0029 [Candidatus Azambacteria bacterium GW2011_GWB2_46_37]KKU42918.1 MAG: hypothetical protein UX56_C0002G0004 [Candidatus Azambacteria bacterium GW2011_GWD2_46_48]HAM96090.1 hypothetical protein [Candidatus Azambacteria bacterium]